MCRVHLIRRIELTIPESTTVVFNMPMMRVGHEDGNDYIDNDGNDDDEEDDDDDDDDDDGNEDDDDEVPSPMLDKQLVLSHPQRAAFVSGCQGWI